MGVFLNTVYIILVHNLVVNHSRSLYYKLTRKLFNSDRRHICVAGLIAPTGLQLMYGAFDEHTSLAVVMRLQQDIEIIIIFSSTVKMQVYCWTFRQFTHVMQCTLGQLKQQLILV